MMENIFDLSTQTVRDIMVPWTDAKWLAKNATWTQVLTLVREYKFSRYPVMDPVTYAPLGYLLMKDLIVREREVLDWNVFIRPVRVVGPNDNLETTMQQLQREGANLAVVMDGKLPVGLVSLEDILEEVVGRIEDEYPRLPRLFLTDALAVGAVELDLTAQTPEAAIRELAALIFPGHLPTGIDVGQLALDRERQMPTDIGYGVAVPHARCPGLARPIIVLGRSADGLVFNPQGEPVRLVFLLITPADRPHYQVFFLSQIAAVAQSDFVRERLLRAGSKEELLEIVRAADPAVTG
jgi:mannitol/fructose-specific phosphotransferase system IIA component (Ntr-type)